MRVSVHLVTIGSHRCQFCNMDANSMDVFEHRIASTMDNYEEYVHEYGKVFIPHPCTPRNSSNRMFKSNNGE